MKKLLFAASLALAAASARAAVAPGSPAPDFTLTDQAGRARRLSEDRGKYVVLEWFDKDCPLDRRRYDDRRMQGLQGEYVGKGVAWYEIATSPEGKRVGVNRKLAARLMKKLGMASTAFLLDRHSQVARLYGAKTAPSIFIVDPDGNLIYMGAVDGAAAALDAALSGKPVPNPVTAPDGCPIRY